jgi:hypothetical protein
MMLTDERLAEMLEAIAPPVGMIALQGADLEAMRSVLRQLLAVRPAVVTIQSAIPKYLKGEMTDHHFAMVVLSAADSSIVNKALEKLR